MPASYFQGSTHFMGEVTRPNYCGGVQLDAIQYGHRIRYHLIKRTQDRHKKLRVVMAYALTPSESHQPTVRLFQASGHVKRIGSGN